mmetsp:Transcript_20802/g.46324  ORF Transcript_20802/g.46324 Transcript_20802/m.46324 type:complete len:243 (+) Transcript_20802:1182-1910(+)
MAAVKLRKVSVEILNSVSRFSPPNMTVRISCTSSDWYLSTSKSQLFRASVDTRVLSLICSVLKSLTLATRNARRCETVGNCADTQMEVFWSRLARFSMWLEGTMWRTIRDTFSTISSSIPASRSSLSMLSSSLSLDTHSSSWEVGVEDTGWGVRGQELGVEGALVLIGGGRRKVGVVQPGAAEIGVDLAEVEAVAAEAKVGSLVDAKEGSREAGNEVGGEEQRAEAGEGADAMALLIRSSRG